MNKQGAALVAARRHNFIVSQTITSGHPGSKKPHQKAYKQGTPGFRHNRKLNDFNEWCYATGNLNCIRRDYR